MIERVLDRVPRFDPRSRNYGIADVKPSYSLRRRFKMWRPGPVLDQGWEGACVGFACTAEVLGAPVAVDLGRVLRAPSTEPTAFARAVYRHAQRIDAWPGEDYSGTSVIAGIQTLKTYGLIREYRWGFATNQVVDGVLGTGPGILGLNWYSGMYRAPGGILRVSGTLEGGHAIYCLGYDPHGAGHNRPGVILQNSWGTSWGDEGFAILPLPDLDRLMHEQGEACIPTRRSYGRR